MRTPRRGGERAVRLGGSPSTRTGRKFDSVDTTHYQGDDNNGAADGRDLSDRETSMAELSILCV